MRYVSGQAFLKDPAKVVVFIGPSGAGKTHGAIQLASGGGWFHDSVDFRIWSQYLADELTAHHQSVTGDYDSAPFISVDDLSATAQYMGMLGNPELGGTSLGEFIQRMNNYAEAERSAMLDLPAIITQAENDHVVVDTSGSVCHMPNLCDPDDPVLAVMEQAGLVVYLKPTYMHMAELIRRATADPKPIYYPEGFLQRELPRLLSAHSATSVEELSPADVGRWLYPTLIHSRLPDYRAIANRTGGITIPMSEFNQANSAPEVLACIARAITRHLP